MPRGLQSGVPNDRSRSLGWESGCIAGVLAGTQVNCGPGDPQDSQSGDRRYGLTAARAAARASSGSGRTRKSA
jgi:hypothetical protein